MSGAQKCVHKGCGKVFTDIDEPCVYHPGPPEFHEGQKGWKCCKPRVLTFDEFLEIPPCTTGKHSTVDETAQLQAEEAKAKRDAQADIAPKRVPISDPMSDGAATPKSTSHSLSAAIPTPPTKPSSPAPELEEDSDDPSVPIPDNTTCKRRACGKSSKEISPSKAQEETCVYHPGVPIFHEGSKGWTCCKRRVLEFDEFMKIEGCKTRNGHCFTGKRTQKRQEGGEQAVEMLAEVRNDFYQTANTLIVSFYLKKIDKTKAKVQFRDDGTGIDLDLPTSDGKRFVKEVDTWREIDSSKCESKILGTKLEMVLVKKEGGLGWPVLRKDDRDLGERIQVGRAGRA